VQPLAQPYPNPAPVESDPDPATAHILDLSYADRCYKTLLSGGHYSTATKSVDVVDQKMREQLAEQAWKALISDDAGGEQNVRHVAVGNAPFVLVELIEALQSHPSLAGEVKRVMQANGLQGEVESSIRKGANLLAEKIASL
jgi:pumilio family protein 6